MMSLPQPMLTRSMSPPARVGLPQKVNALQRAVGEGYAAPCQERLSLDECFHTGLS